MMYGQVILNEDNSGFFFTRSGKTITLADIEAWASQYANTHVRELTIGVNSMRTSFASEVWDPIWKGYDPQFGDDQPMLAAHEEASRSSMLRWIRTALQLHEDGIDVYAHMIAGCRKAGVSPSITIRMNDVHDANNESSCMHSTLWRERPDLRRTTYKFDDWADRSFDYAQQEVRDYHFALIREVVERYDIDGLELDWMRFGYHFRPGYEAEGTDVLTAFVTDVRELLDVWAVKRGHPIRLSARVPSRPEAALSLGLDACTWARRGLVQLLVITPFWQTIETDMPIELWKQLLHGTGVKLAAGLELLVRAYPESPLRQKNTLETVRGAAMSLLSRGADFIYLFNYMDSQTTIDNLEDYPTLLNEVGSLETLRGKTRRHIVTYADTWAPGAARARLLPLKSGPNSYATLRIHLGERPDWQETAFCLSFKDGESLADDDNCEVLVNGIQCRYDGIYELANPRPEGTVYRFIIPKSALKDGYHVVDVKTSRKMTIDWAEMIVSGTE